MSTAPAEPDWPRRVERALDAARALAADPARWSARVQAELAPGALGADPAGFLAWARADREWALVVAECASRVCAKPAEAAAFVLEEGLRQRLVDEGALADEED